MLSPTLPSAKIKARLARGYIPAPRTKQKHPSPRRAFLFGAITDHADIRNE